MKLGIITYDNPHLKTTQLVCNFLNDKRIKEIKLYALPFKERKKRSINFNHRPDMTLSPFTRDLAALPNVTFEKWDGRKNLSLFCDFFIVGGAGILDVSFASDKPIINAHGGIIPLTRGLDSFKWAIYNNDPIGNTLHLIDEQVDKGQILAIRNTPIFESDNIETLARRHYEMEISLLSNVLKYIDNRVTPTENEKAATMRMNVETERIMIKNFEKWKALMLKN